MPASAPAAGDWWGRRGWGWGWSLAAGIGLGAFSYGYPDAYGYPYGYGDSRLVWNGYTWINLCYGHAGPARYGRGGCRVAPVGVPCGGIVG